MIPSSLLASVGQFNKPHGIRGELSAVIDCSPETLSELKCIFVEFDGLMVPFFIKSLRPKGKESVLLTIDGVDDEVRASNFSRKDIYVEKDGLGDEDIDDDIVYLQDLKGFTIYDGEEKTGIITDVDDSTENILFVVATEDSSSILVPASEELIDEIEFDNKTIVMHLPAGLKDL